MSGRITISVFCTLIILALAVSAHAEKQPVQLALIAPIQIFPEDYTIGGVRVNLLYGRNAAVRGLDLGLVNHTTTGVSMGLQHGVVSINEADFVGWQDNAVNITRGDFEGFQSGLVNYANYANGVQLGLVNYAVSMKGLQVGLVNIIRQGGQFPVFPIVNWSF